MRTTSATGRLASSRARPRRRSAAAPTALRAGFTLIEILVVLAIVALITGAAVLSLGLISSQSGLRRDAERLQARLLAARERAELENRDFGVRLQSAGYQFLVFDPGTARWLPSDDRVLGEVRWSSPLVVQLEVDGRRVLLQDAEQREDGTRAGDAVPDFGVDPSGEFTAFSLRLAADGAGPRYTLAPDEAGDLRLQESGPP